MDECLHHRMECSRNRLPRALADEYVASNLQHHPKREKLRSCTPLHMYNYTADPHNFLGSYTIWQNKLNHTLAKQLVHPVISSSLSNHHYSKWVWPHICSTHSHCVLTVVDSQPLASYSYNVVVISVQVVDSIIGIVVFTFTAHVLCNAN